MDWPTDAALWFVADRRHDGRWVVIVGLRGAPIMMGRPHATKEDAERTIGRLWADLQPLAHDVLIGPTTPDIGPI